MGDELGAIAQRAVDAALAAGAGDAEAYVQDSLGREIRVFDGEVESLTEAGERGVGVRCWIDHRAGYAYGTELSEEGLGRIGQDAVETARIADADEFAAAPLGDGAGAPAIPGLHDPSLAGWTTERKIELAKRIERAAREADDRVVAVETAVYVDEEQRVAIASSTGLAGAFEATSAYAYTQAIAEARDDKQTGLGFGMGRSPEGLDSEEIGREAAERAATLLGARKPSSRTCPVVLDPTVAASFVGFIGGTLCADTVQRGRSLFAGRLGEVVASPALTVTDHATDPAGLNSSPFDAEGTPRGQTPLIEAGELVAYLHDSYTARRQQAQGAAGARTTANASRAGYRSPPSVSTSNLIIAPGSKSFEELLAEAGDGVYVTDVAGLHSGVNPVSGTFSVGATGRLIEGGRLAAPADEFTIASDLQSMLKTITAVASEARWVPFGGSISAPALLLGEMAVGGS
ncbi:MAG TPA: TldD/PmbA family protein [Solirubrobacterales bacterium]|nr:TldD/PmbA family protein [Solirubrobacterales bacterium]